MEAAQQSRRAGAKKNPRPAPWAPRTPNHRTHPRWATGELRETAPRGTRRSQRRTPRRSTASVGSRATPTTADRLASVGPRGADPDAGCDQTHAHDRHCRGAQRQPGHAALRSVRPSVSKGRRSRRARRSAQDRPTIASREARTGWQSATRDHHVLTASRPTIARMLIASRDRRSAACAASSSKRSSKSVEYAAVTEHPGRTFGGRLSPRKQHVLREVQNERRVPLLREAGPSHDPVSGVRRNLPSCGARAPRGHPACHRRTGNVLFDEPKDEFRSARASKTRESVVQLCDAGDPGDADTQNDPELEPGREADGCKCADTFGRFPVIAISRT